MLHEAAATRFNDFFEFLVGEAREDLEGAPGGGSRYPVQARMDGRDLARFHVDVGIGDEVLEPLDVVTGEDWPASATACSAKANEESSPVQSVRTR
jgi:hypothetical protein